MKMKGLGKAGEVERARPCFNAHPQAASCLHRQFYDAPKLEVNPATRLRLRMRCASLSLESSISSRSQGPRSDCLFLQLSKTVGKMGSVRRG